MPTSRVRRSINSAETEDKFYREDGHLTEYAFSLGYMEEYVSADGHRFRLYLDGTRYYVRGRTSNTNVVRDQFFSRKSATQRAETLGEFEPAPDAFSGI